MRWYTTGVLFTVGLLGYLGAPVKVRANETDQRDARALAARIDARIADHWKKKQVSPTTSADSSAFVRRVHLDLVGRIPDLITSRDYPQNNDPAKMGKLVDKLLSHPRHPQHLAAVWRALLVPDGVENPFGGNYRGSVEAYLREEFKKGAGYHQIVRGLLQGQGTGPVNVNFAFLQAIGTQPENQASAVSRLFLGVKLECAQCHNHPFARWTRQQFWETAAFFNDMTRGRPAGNAPFEIRIPGTEKTAQARFLDGTPRPENPRGTPREVFLEWMTRTENPYFARAAVNRVWEYLFGTGLVDPVDEAGPDNLPSHPELLDELAKEFVARNYNLSFVFRTLVQTQVYQLSSRQTHPDQADARVFARQQIRGLSPEQLFDSLALATGHEESTPDIYNPRVFNPTNSPRAEFLRRFPNQDKRREQTTSILQALYFMNGRVVTDATSLRTNKNLAVLAEGYLGKTSPTARRIEQLFYLTLNRKPTQTERDRLVRYVDQGGPTANQDQALCDVFWAVLNSSEFCVNH